MHPLFPIDLKRFGINRVIRSFIISDLLIYGGWGLIGPIFGVFVLERIAGARLITIGISVGIYWIIKSIVQIPVAIYIDRHDGERDDFYALILGLVLGGFSALAYLIPQTAIGLYVVSAVHGVAFAFYVPSWYAIFSRHLEKKHYAFDWALDSTMLGIASGVTAIVGAGIAEFVSFEAVFVAAGIFSFASVLILLLVPHLILPRVPKAGVADDGHALVKKRV